MCLSLKEKNDYSETALKLSQQLLMLNPDVTTVWNYRSSYVKKTLDELKEDSEKRRELISKELELTKRIIQTKDTKCYPLWHYRKWLFTLEPSLLTKTEVDLCEQLLKVDERNFHCWNYWKYVSDLLKLTPEELLDFTYKRIEHNFSNYSAWSYRLSILVHSYEKNLLKEDIRTHIDNELELILNAVYTEPDDQSAWYYQKSLFDYLLSSTIYSQDELHTMIENRINEIQELIEVEPDCQMAKDCLKLLEQLL